MDLGKLTTERRNPQTMNLDKMTIPEMLELMNQEDAKVADAIKIALPEIGKAVEVIVASLKSGGRLIYMGAGTSGRLGVLDAAECVPTFGVSSDVVVGLIAGGERAMTKAVEGAEDSKELGQKDLENLKLTKNDVVVGIAASGRTPYVIGGLQYAKTIEAHTVTIACNRDAEISKFSQIPIEVDAGPEILTGSTRLKAGTAQKLILNMLSTCSMVGIGKVYQNLMVDVQPTNEKLEERSKRIIMEATECSYEDAAKAFEASGNQVKLAIVMLLTDSKREEAELKLSKSQGFIHDAIKK
ncbi:MULTISPECIES: N-acetylmuramic acid 6-phosphate etherase [unclassified Jeotgalibaca]|uniref:N-acetylmuramic acid 6-phosphate etherase n=1 Tax=unclassified Jeotgalibaca TaxID=2621505 RepID=UPI003FD2099D